MDKTGSDVKDATGEAKHGTTAHYQMDDYYYNGLDEEGRRPVYMESTKRNGKEKCVFAILRFEWFDLVVELSRCGVAPTLEGITGGF